MESKMKDWGKTLQSHLLKNKSLKQRGSKLDVLM